MGYSDLAACVNDLEQHGYLKRIDYPVDPVLEIGAIQRRVFQNQGPALLFTQPKGCNFPMLANLYGSIARLEYIFRDSLPILKIIFQLKANPAQIWKKLACLPAVLRAASKMRPKYLNSPAPVMGNRITLKDLPGVVSWPEDGGAFITLPIVQTRDNQGKINLGMYRIQISGNEYQDDECGVHYQIHRGIGIHHAQALASGKKLAVNIYVGGPPCLAIAAVMPMPEGMSELMIAGLLAGNRQKLYVTSLSALPVLGECDFMIAGELGADTKPEGPFGDHLGYYSLKHDFPVLKVSGVYHKHKAIWPFTTVGRPPQEDTIFGAFIHQLTGPLISQVFPGVQEVHAVDAAGVHPLLLAIGSERYTPYETVAKSRELLTQAFHLLGDTQTSLAKYLVIANYAPGLTTHNIKEFLKHVLERTNFSKDLHFISNATCDTLDYSGRGLHEGSKLIWTVAGQKLRNLASELSGNLDLPAEFGHPTIVMPGILAIQGPAHKLERSRTDPVIEKKLCRAFEQYEKAENFPLVVVCDDSQFCAASLANFLWITFTRSDPATDVYGAFAENYAKNWFCHAPLIIDARQKPFHAPPLTEDEAVLKRMENLACKGGPLHGLF